ncbi:transcriptional regulator [Algimonas ampicilliniresistens]|uniref:Transcriptional regulator n=1 Tax=Algimonas ampicilliniresistens TaxID=1298735 RepID=A0ABQ5VDI0_9PROT|nr:metalloregulator ArsR/SmtB family transcription factor [Algimonas ampicilliniresistens]GLQ24636.1 transcriptional regulator [Algimonas ampicilliniresistens]
MMNTVESLNPQMFESKADDAAALLKAMSNPHRLIILCRLGASEASVGELLVDSGLSQSALSQHLAVLRQKGLVETRREAQTIYYTLADPAVRQIIETLMKIFCPEMLK